MPDEITQRLQECSAKCVDAYENWHGNKKDPKARGTLHDAVHELRKVSSRLEIELATSDREEGAQKPMPIPQNRNARGRRNDNAGNNEQNNAEKGNAPKGQDEKSKGPIVESAKPKRKGTLKAKSDDQPPAAKEA